MNRKIPPMNPFSTRTNKIFWVGVLLSIALFSIGYFHSTKGLDLTDEGMYVATALRYSLGDMPFRDEIMNSACPFDVPVSFMFKVWPRMTLLQVRLAGVALHVASTLVIFLFLARYSSPLFAAVICATAFLANNFFGIYSPSYNSISSDSLIISVSLWLFALGTAKPAPRIILAVLGGVFLGIAGMCYTVITLVICVPLAFLTLFLFKSKENRNMIQATGFFIMTFAVFVTVVVTTIISKGLLPHMVHWITEMTKISYVVTKGPIAKIYSSSTKISHNMLHAAAILAVFSAAMFVIPPNNRKTTVLRMFAALLTLMAVLYIAGIFHHETIRYMKFLFVSFAICLISTIFFIKNIPNVIGGRKDLSWIASASILTIWGLASSLVYVTFSGTGENAMLGSGPLFLCGMVSLYRIVSSRYNAADARRDAKIFFTGLVYMIALFFFAECLWFNYNCVYREADISQLKSKFTEGKLKGIYSTGEKVKVINKLLEYLNGRLKPGGRLLAYNNIPMLYFLTDTRSAYGFSWASESRPIAFQKKLLDKMLKDGHKPVYCVKMLTYPSGEWDLPLEYSKDSPLNNYVMDNYYLETTIYPFEIWHRRQNAVD